MITKTCAKCKRQLRPIDFHNAKGAKSCRLNLSSRCKRCRSEDRKVSDFIKQKNKRQEDKRLQINELSKEDAAYIAGIVDGEGSLNLNRVHSNDPNRKATYSIRMRITNTFPGLLDWIGLKVGYGSIGQLKKYKIHYKQAYEWILNGRRAVVLLKQLYPYLKVKKLQADVIFEYAETLTPPGQVKLTQNVINIREDLKEQITCLNG